MARGSSGRRNVVILDVHRLEHDFIGDGFIEEHEKAVTPAAVRAAFPQG